MKRIALLCLPWWVACAGMYQTTFKQDLIRRVSWEFQCPEASLKLTPLADVHDVVKTYGVEGCGHRAVYVLGGTGSSWVRDAPAAATPPAPSSN